MTEVIRWRAAGQAKHVHRPLPEPPRHRRVSKVGRAPKDAALEDWLKDLAVTATHDAD